jgi:hypothetical protein
MDNPERRGVHLTARSLKIVLILDPVAVATALKPFATVEHRIPMTIEVGCQSAFKIDPLSASKIDPPLSGVACAGSP